MSTSGEYILPLPQAVRALVEAARTRSPHPGLMLDRFLEWPVGLQDLHSDREGPGKVKEWKRDQGEQKRLLQEVARLQGQSSLLESLAARRKGYLAQLGARVFDGMATGPFTLHLSRAAALENAGICLHPIYGFVFIPGTGLKGMARAFAETAWLKEKGDRPEAKERVIKVFGDAEDARQSGAIVFHDAWPVEWPHLEVDIVNCHHPGYYQGSEGRDFLGPGDWETPNMVYFLSLRPGAKFSFAVSKRHPDADDALLELAIEWLVGALAHLGAGAKTAAGYGGFELSDVKVPRLPEVGWAATEATLELVTPAFLAGASQEEPRGCTLRPATLRGLLRWWWRTLHAGHVSPPELRRIEAAVWGDTGAGGAVRVSVEENPENPNPIPYDKAAEAEGLPIERDRKTTLGLYYHSYGMGERRIRRHYAPPGSKWRVHLTARGSRFPSGEPPERARDLSAGLILQQARAALWLLCRFGGVGSKGRKGFGCFQDLEGPDLEECKREAARFRQACGAGGAGFREAWADSPSLEQMLPPLEINSSWKDWREAVHHVGYAAEAFAKKFKHDRKKVALGLPRKINDPRGRDYLRGPRGDRHASPVHYNMSADPVSPVDDRPRGDRHASPVHYHFSKASDESLTFRCVAFPARFLPDLEASRKMLGDLLEHLKEDVARRIREPGEFGRRPVGPQPPGPYRGLRPERRPQQDARMHPPGIPRPGEKVQAVLLEKNKKGNWEALHQPTGFKGTIINSSRVPGDVHPGASVLLIVKAFMAADKKFNFEWPEEAPPEKPAGKRGNK